MYAIQTPAARSTDPHSSHEADEQMNASGKKALQQRIAVAAVEKHPGKTSLEIARATGQCRFMLARRLPEVEAAGLVRRGQERTCSVSKRRACTWYAPDVAEQASLFSGRKSA